MGSGCTKGKPQKQCRYLKKCNDCPYHELVIVYPDNSKNDKPSKCHLCGNTIIPIEKLYYCRNCNREECKICFKETESVLKDEA